MKKKKMTATVVLALCLLVCLAQVSKAEPMGTSITYQGRLMDKNKPADGEYDFQFKLYDGNDPCTGIQLASTIDINNLDVIDGHFIVELDFGSNIFDGNAVWLETRVVHSPMGSDPATLRPLVELTPTPYAFYAEMAGGDNDWRISGDNMYSIPSGTVSVRRSRGAMGPGLEVSRSFTSPQIGRAWMEIDDTLIDTYSWILGGQTIGTSLSLNSNSSGNVMLAGGGGNVGVGTTNPLSKLSVGGDGIADVGVYGSGREGGVYGLDSYTNSYGRLGYATYGVYGNGNYGVYGNGRFFGVYGISDSVGVSGEDSDSGCSGRLGYGDFGGYFNGDGYFSGNVGIGTYNPSHKLDVNDGTINAEGTQQYTLRVINNGSSTGAPYWASLFSSNVEGASASYAVYGSAKGASDKNIGGHFAASGGTENFAIWSETGTNYFSDNVGIGTANPEAGLHVQGTGHPSSFMYLQSDANEDAGIRLYEGNTEKWHLFNDSSLHGLSLRNNAYSSILFVQQSTGNIGIGTTIPRSKLSVGGDGIYNTGVYGSSSEFGVYGENNRYKHYGYLGGKNSGAGGYNATSGNYGYLGCDKYGVYGRADDALDWAGYFQGHVTVAGTLTAAVKLFKIDHPLDPENKYLNHTSVESSEIMNVYSGNVILDENGEAQVQLPEWFESLNTDFRYQLTCIGGFAQVYIAEEIYNNQFTIAGGAPGIKVSWQVSGVRHDPYAEANPLEVEEDKAPDELGYYMYPEGYGYGQEKSINSLNYPEATRLLEESESEVTDATSL